MDIGIERKKNVQGRKGTRSWALHQFLSTFQRDNNIINIFVVLTHLQHAQYFYTILLCNIIYINSRHVIVSSRVPRFHIFWPFYVSTHWYFLRFCQYSNRPRMIKYTHILRIFEVDLRYYLKFSLIIVKKKKNGVTHSSSEFCITNPA